MKIKTIKKSIDINAPKENVWNVLLQDNYNRQWYAEFNPGTHATTTWETNSRVMFTEDNNNGITGTITENKPMEILAIEYDGEVANNVEIFDSPMAIEMKGSKEVYTLLAKNGTTQLNLSCDMGEDYFDMMSAQWEKALQVIKKLSEEYSG
jgi:uncharacterized protein YndB with AHSA1/START domain